MTAVETAPRSAPVRVEDPFADTDWSSAGRHARPLQPKVRRTPAPLRPWAFVLTWILAVSGLLALWVVAYGIGLSGIQEHRNQTVLYAELRENLAAATTPIGGSAASGAPVALVSAPQLGLEDVVVVQGTTPAELTRGPGHRADTPMPGQAGVSVLMGRSATFGAPFADIVKAPAGATITVTTGQGTFTYVVDRVRRSGDLVPLPPATGTGRLVLMTSTADSWRALGQPSDTVVVDATLKGEPKPEPAGRPSAVPEAAKPMKGQPAAAVPLLLWLQGLLIVVIACLWGQARWGRRATWLAGVPLCLALLWGASQYAMLLLPNLV